MGKKRLDGSFLRITPKLSTANKGKLGPTYAQMGLANSHCVV